MKKTYIEPRARFVSLNCGDIMDDYTLNPNSPNPSAKPSDEEYDGEFGANTHSIWDEEEVAEPDGY